MLNMISSIKRFFSNPEVISIIQFFLVIIIAVFSAICTYKLTINTFNSEAIAWMLTIIIEGCLTLFSFKFHRQNKFYVLIWIPYLLVSIIASQGAIIGDSDTKTADKIHTSPEYLKYESDVKNYDAQINTYQNRLSSLSGDNSAALNELNSKLSQRRSDLKKTISTPKTQRLRNDIKNEIDSIEKSKKELLGISTNSTTEAKSIQDAITDLNTKKIAAKSEFESDLTKIGGVSSAFKTSLEKIGLTEVKFWTAFFFLLEITRFILLNDTKKLQELLPAGGGLGRSKKSLKDRINDWKESRNENGNTANTTASSETTIVSKSPKKFKIKKRTKSVKNTIVAKSPKKFKIKKRTKSVKNNVIQLPSPTPNYQTFTNKELETYLDYMYSNTIDTINGIEAPGITRMSKAKLGLSYKTCRAIHGYLTTLGVIMSKKRTTLILKPKSDVLCTSKLAI